MPKTTSEDCQISEDVLNHSQAIMVGDDLQCRGFDREH